MFQSSNIQSNPDSSDLTQAARNQFQEQQPSMLNTKHQNIIKDIQRLQDVEKYMFNNLQSLNKSSGSDLQKSEVIKSRLNELSTMRMGLFNQLKNMYTDGQSETANSRSNLADQITMVKVIENELQNARNELDALEKERKNKKRLVELTEYEYDRYRSHKNICIWSISYSICCNVNESIMVSIYCWCSTYLYYYCSSSCNCWK